jgi:hypothetical protein
LVIADAFKIVYKGAPLGVEKEETIKDFVLYQNYPNPFNPSTTISWRMNVAGRVSIKVFDVLGREVKTVIDEVKQPGVYKTEFNGKNLSSGVYYYRISAGDYAQSKGMLLLK